MDPNPCADRGDPVRGSDRQCASANAGRPRPGFDRGQSETVGTVLLVACVVLVVGVLSVPVLSTFDGGDEPATTVAVDVGPDRVAVSHAGGDPLPVETVAVVRSWEGGKDRVDLGRFDGLADGDRWEPGQRGTHSHVASEGLRVIVVHEPSGTVLAEVERDVPDA